MLEAERHYLIRTLLKERSILRLTDLVAILGASGATVRRDISALADKGELRRVRGGAESLSPRQQAHLSGVPFQLNRRIGGPQKRAIARVAADLISDGESIIINGGTTTLHLTEFLATRSLDILTNSMPIVARLLAEGCSRLTVPGGTIYREQNIILSPYDNDAIGHFWGHKLLTGCYGINRFGIMEADPLLVQAEVKLMKRADELIVLADSSKLRQRSSMIAAPLERISVLVTDTGANEEELEPFQSAGIRVVRAEVKHEDDLLMEIDAT